MINETLAKRLFPDEPAVGDRLINVPPGAGPLAQYASPDAEIIGVVSDVKFTSLSETTDPAVYFVHDQGAARRMTITVRTAGDPLSYTQSMRAQVGAMDELVALGRIETMARIVGGSFATQRFAMILLAVFAGVALVLASVGVYGVVSYGVEQRNTELAVRMALGADPRKVVALVMRHGWLLAAFGVGSGLLAAWAAGQVLSSYLFGVTTRDPITFGAVAVVLSFVALVATLIPAIRATGIAPAVALKPK